MPVNLRATIQVRSRSIVSDLGQYFIGVIYNFCSLPIQASDRLQDIGELVPPFLSLLAQLTSVFIDGSVIFYNGRIFRLHLVFEML